MDTGTGLARNVRHGGRYIQQHAAYARKVKKVWQYRCQCSSSMATRL